MKMKFVVLASAAMIVQLKAGDVRPGAATHRGAIARPGPVAHAGSAAHAPVRSGGISSFHPMPTHNFGGRSIYSGPRSSSFGMRSAAPRTFPRHPVYQNRVTITRSGPFTAVTINQGNVAANHRNPAVTSMWNPRNTGSNFANRNVVRNGNNIRNANNARNGNRRLRGDWQKHVFARQSGNWHRDWDRHCDHWWNGHRCSFVNGSWVIFNIGFVPWWPSWSYPDDYYYDYGFPNDGYGSSTYGYNSPYSYNYDPSYYDSGDYQGQMYYDQNSYPDQSQGSYDSMVYQTEVDSDQNADGNYSANDVVVAAQERLARQGYYHGETDGTYTPEMQKAVKNYQITNGLRASGYLDADTLSVMGLQNPSY
jgi:putative peptidoglycan binding protein